MNQTQKVDDDLQKAINDITKTTSVDAVFSDPVAAPSMVEGGANEPIEAVGPFNDPATIPDPKVAAAPVVPDLAMASFASASTDDMNIQQTKAAALKDLVPIIDRVDITPSQRFHFYREYFEMLHDYSVVEPAYNVVKMITDEKERAEGLLYILDVIDNM